MKTPIELFKDWTLNPIEDKELDDFFDNKYAKEIIKSILHHACFNTEVVKFGQLYINKNDIVDINEDGSILVHDRLSELFQNVSPIIQSKNKPQKTYLIKNNRNGYYKIGKSLNVIKREKTLQSEDPDVNLISYTNIDIESNIHDIFKEKRLRGEWFCLNNEDVNQIIEMFESYNASVDK